MWTDGSCSREGLKRILGSLAGEDFDLRPLETLPDSNGLNGSYWLKSEAAYYRSRPMIPLGPCRMATACQGVLRINWRQMYWIETQDFLLAKHVPPLRNNPSPLSLICLEMQRLLLVLDPKLATLHGSKIESILLIFENAGWKFCLVPINQLKREPSQAFRAGS